MISDSLITFIKGVLSVKYPVDTVERSVKNCVNYMNTHNVDCPALFGQGTALYTFWYAGSDEPDYPDLNHPDYLALYDWCHKIRNYGGNRQKTFDFKD